MLRKLHFLILVFAIMPMAFISGQQFLKKANKQFELKAYDLAIQNYIKALTELPDDLESQVKLAECYRLSNRPLDAVAWYRKVVDQAVKPEYILNYAHTLKEIGKYDDAAAYYSKYKESNPLLGEHYALSCDFAKHLLSEEEKYQLSLFGANTKASDFGVSFFDDNVVFSSFNDVTKKLSESNRSFINKGVNRLYIAEGLRPDYRSEALLLRSDLQEDENVGPVSYGKGTNLCAYTQNTFVNGHALVEANDVDLSIHIAEVDYNGDFKESKPFTYNELGYSTGFPCLSFDGATALYFASNRPGGLGGYDLYVSYLNDGVWSYPANLGESVNTPGNEITPFFDGKVLMFASDYHQGLGGFDIFKCTVNNGAWEYPENMGRGVNSPADDYFPATPDMNDDIYFSSNRLGGRGKDDIYIASPNYRNELAAISVQEEENAFVPKAVSLADMNPFNGLESNNRNTNATAVSLNEARKEKLVMIDATTAVSSTDKQESKESVAGTTAPAAFKLPTNNNMTNAASNVSLVNARKVAYGEIIKTSTNVFFVQLAAIYSENADISNFKSLVEYGNIYKVYKSSATKIRLGYYLDRNEAQQVLDKVRGRGFKDAFITYDALNTDQLELALSSKSVSTDMYISPEGVSEYKVRLASYEDPIWFDVNQVKGVGQIEQWTKGGWTIFVLSGYSSLEEARRAQIKAINRGFSDAEVVVDNNGILERLVQN